MTSKIMAVPNCLASREIQRLNREYEYIIRNTKKEKDTDRKEREE